MNNLPKRKQNRIKDYDYSMPGAYFITVCTANREQILWNTVGEVINLPYYLMLSPVGKVVEQAVKQIEEHYEDVSIDKYCIMPDHIHFILHIHAAESGRMISSPTVSTIVGQMKRWTSKQIGKPIWQKSFYDHGIRDERDYQEIWQYIDNNPLKYLIK